MNRPVYYRELFDQYLTDLLQGTEELIRHSHFVTWLAQGGFVCSRCEKSFDPALKSTREDDELLCRSCRKEDSP